MSDVINLDDYRPWPVIGFYDCVCGSDLFSVCCRRDGEMYTLCNECGRETEFKEIIRMGQQYLDDRTSS